MARLSLPAILALTEEISHQVSTCPSIMTGVGAAVIDVWAAIGQNKIYVRYIKRASNTLFMLKHGFGFVMTLGRLTDLAVDALPSVAADALVHADFVDAGASIAAWVTLAVIDV